VPYRVLGASVPVGVPVGTIVMWSGAIAAIPPGWALCTGADGTPDLRDKFVVGARQDSGGVAKTNLTGALTQSGGNKDHTHTANHGHGVTAYLAQTGTGINAAVSVTDAVLTTGVNSVQPPYYALAFIMKLAA